MRERGKEKKIRECENGKRTMRVKATVKEKDNVKKSKLKETREKNLEN